MHQLCARQHVSCALAVYSLNELDWGAVLFHDETILYETDWAKCKTTTSASEQRHQTETNRTIESVVVVRTASAHTGNGKSVINLGRVEPTDLHNSRAKPSHSRSLGDFVCG